MNTNKRLLLVIIIIGGTMENKLACEPKKISLTTKILQKLGFLSERDPHNTRAKEVQFLVLYEKKDFNVTKYSDWSAKIENMDLQQELKKDLGKEYILLNGFTFEWYTAKKRENGWKVAVGLLRHGDDIIDVSVVCIPRDPKQNTPLLMETMTSTKFDNDPHQKTQLHNGLKQFIERQLYDQYKIINGFVEAPKLDPLGVEAHNAFFSVEKKILSDLHLRKWLLSQETTFHLDKKDMYDPAGGVYREVLLSSTKDDEQDQLIVSRVVRNGKPSAYIAVRLKKGENPEVIAQDSFLIEESYDTRQDRNTALFEINKLLHGLGYLAFPTNFFWK